MAWFRHELAIDLGTANTVIFKDDQVVLDEPSIIAVETKTGKLVAIGNEAQLIEEHTNPRIYTIRPLMNGVIADYDAAEMMHRSPSTQYHYYFHRNISITGLRD